MSRGCPRKWVGGRKSKTKKKQERTQVRKSRQMDERTHQHVNARREWSVVTWSWRNIFLHSKTSVHCTPLSFVYLPLRAVEDSKLCTEEYTNNSQKVVPFVVPMAISSLFGQSKLQQEVSSNSIRQEWMCASEHHKQWSRSGDTVSDGSSTAYIAKVLSSKVPPPLQLSFVIMLESQNTSDMNKSFLPRIVKKFVDLSFPYESIGFVPEFTDFSHWQSSTSTSW